MRDARENGSVFTYFTEVEPVSKEQSIIELLAFSVAIGCGVVGNTAVLLAVWFDPRLHSATNYLIGNQAASDLLFLIAILPFVANRWLGTWPVGGAICKGCLYVQCVANTVSVYTICAIAVERMRSISRSRGTAMSGKQTGILVVVLWIVVMLMCSFIVVNTDALDIVVDGRTLRYCKVDTVFEETSEGGVVLAYLFCVGFFLAAVLFLVCIYGRIIYMVQKSTSRMRGHSTRTRRNNLSIRLERRLVLMLVISAILFFVMWAPTTFFGALVLAHHYHMLTPTSLTVSVIIVTINMSVNPLLLFHFNVFFRDNVRQAFRGKCSRRGLSHRTKTVNFSLDGNGGDGILRGRTLRKIHPAPLALVGGTQHKTKDPDRKMAHDSSNFTTKTAPVIPPELANDGIYTDPGEINSFVGLPSASISTVPFSQSKEKDSPKGNHSPSVLRETSGDSHTDHIPSPMRDASGNSRTDHIPFSILRDASGKSQTENLFSSFLRDAYNNFRTNHLSSSVVRTASGNYRTGNLSSPNPSDVSGDTCTDHSSSSSSATVAFRNSRTGNNSFPVLGEALDRCSRSQRNGRGRKLAARPPCASPVHSRRVRNVEDRECSVWTIE